MTMQQISLSILAGQDGGLVVYELVDGEQTLVFGGDLAAATKYLEGRMANIIVNGERKADPIPHRTAFVRTKVSAAIDDLAAAE